VTTLLTHLQGWFVKYNAPSRQAVAAEAEEVLSVVRDAGRVTLTSVHPLAFPVRATFLIAQLRELTAVSIGVLRAATIKFENVWEI